MLRDRLDLPCDVNELQANTDDQASSDATNISMTIQRNGDSYVLQGKKWWTSGAGDPRCKVLIVMVCGPESHLYCDLLSSAFYRLFS